MGWVLFALLLYSAYYPVGLVSEDLPFYTPTTLIDTALPLRPAWLYPYSMVLYVGMLPVFVVRHRGLFRRVALAYMTLELVSLATFLLLPVQMIGRVVPEPTSFANWGISLTHWLDTPSNCLPSLHVAGTTLAALCCFKVDRLTGSIAGVLAVVISLSTLLVKQHYLVDLVTGGLLAWACWRIFVAPFDATDLSTEDLRLNRTWTLVPVAAWLATVAGLLALYTSGWVPPAG